MNTVGVEILREGNINVSEALAKITSQENAEMSKSRKFRPAKISSSTVYAFEYKLLK